MLNFTVHLAPRYQLPVTSYHHPIIALQHIAYPTLDKVAATTHSKKKKKKKKKQSVRPIQTPYRNPTNDPSHFPPLTPQRRLKMDARSGAGADAVLIELAAFLPSVSAATIETFTEDYFKATRRRLEGPELLAKLRL